MVQPLKITMVLGAALGAASAVACADMGMSRFGSLPPQAYNPVSAQVRRTAPTVLDSADGVARVEIPPLAVQAEVTISLVRVEGVDAVSGEPWLAYQLEPADLVLERPARVSLSQAAQPAGAERANLRVGRLLDERGEAWWQVLEEPQATSTQVLGRSAQLGRFAVVDVTRDRVVGSAPFTSTSEADVLLSRGQLDAARAAYAAVRARDAEDARAVAGHALSALLLLPDHAALRNLLARCNLPPLDEAGWFGAGGYLDRLAEDHDGEATLGLELTASTSALVAESIVARPGQRWMRLRVEDRDHIDGPWVLRVELDLAAAGERYAFGQDLAASDFPGRIELESPTRRLRAQAGSMGLVHVESAGRGVNQELGLRFEGVTLVDAQGQRVRLTGTVRDVLRRAPAPPHPLFETADDPGPPHRGRLAVLLDGCSAGFTAPFAFAQALALRGELASIADDLEAALALGGDQVLLPGLPAFLLRADQDLVPDRRDTLLLVQLLRGLVLALDLAGPYRWFGHDEAGQPVALASFLDLWTRAHEAADGSLGEREERALSPWLLAADLNRNLLVHDGDATARVADLAPLREPLGQWLAASAAALGLGASASPLFPLDAPAAGALVQSLRQLLGVLQRTLAPGATAEPAPASPGYQVLLRRLFEAPPEHAALVAACQDGVLFEVAPGDPAASTAAARNPALAMSPDLELELARSALELPPAPTVTDCALDLDCGAPGLSCDLAGGRCAGSGEACDQDLACADASACIGRCARAAFAPVDAEALDAALAGERPAFIGAALWRLLEPLGEAWPAP